MMPRPKPYEVEYPITAVGADQINEMLRILFEEQESQSSAASSSGLEAPSGMANGDLILGQSATALGRLGIGANHTVLKSDGAIPSWAQVDLAEDVTGDLDTSHLAGGSGASSSTFWRGDGSWAAPVSADTMGLSDTGNEFAWRFNNNAIVAIGTSAPSSPSTYTSFSDNSYGTFSIAASAGASGAIESGGGNPNGFELQHTGTFTCWIRTGTDITNVRYWIGIRGTSTSPSNSDTAPNQWCGFRYSTVAGDGGWVGVTKATGLQSVSSTVDTIAANTRYKLQIVFTGSQASFSVNGGAAQVLSSNFPSNNLNCYISVILFTTTATAKSLHFSRLTLRYGN